MIKQNMILVFTLDGQRYGLPLDAVERVVRMVEITQLPEAPAAVRGVINFQGEIIPVLDLRQRFGLPERPVELDDQLIIITTVGRKRALIADTACEVRECPEESFTEAAGILPPLPLLTGIAKSSAGLILLHDPGSLLSPGEAQTLDSTLELHQP
ncbi:MAG: chemotaxis protein CheW [Desulfuromonadaceae bacterium]|nr:chemotaxis protein CheW [Desulfuromonadaceae bacterium]